MKEQTWINLIDRSKWEDGLWNGEPDKKQWEDPATEYPCLAVRNDFGAWCGYVGVEETHPLYGVSYDEIHCPIEVHGGLTFANFCDERSHVDHRICHIPEPGEPDNLWWLGFDCNHVMDYAPGLFHKPLKSDNASYKTLDYVRVECERLASQLCAHESPQKNPEKE